LGAAGSGAACTPVDSADTVPDRIDEDCDGRVDENVDATRARCPRGARVIVGTRGDDTLRGTSGRDCIFGYGGNDTIYGESGDDLIFGGAGDDRIFTGRGRDVVRAGAGNDVVDTTSSSRATVFGDSGNDTLTGGSGYDTFFGGADNDKLNGGGGTDLLSGGSCHDSLVGGSSFDLGSGGSDVDACDTEIATECERNTRTRKLCSNDGECAAAERCAVHAGFCVARTAKACGAGTGCTPTASSDESCNGVDDDCSGSVDEDFASEPTDCGEGSCQATGETSCVDGAVVDSCSAGTPGGSDVLCNGLDDDCNGAIDEDFVSVPTMCGAGSCQATGTTACMNGTVVDSCMAGTPGSADDDCDDVDDDCDGDTDEGYVTTPTTCGAGACSATGTLSCVDGVEVNSCAAGTGATSDTSCNSVDDDCDGSLDEDYAPVTTSCGSGPCARTGETSCVDGIVVDSCEAGLPSADSDSSCDNVDDDCDGTADDDYVPIATTCGYGDCETAGTTACEGGEVTNDCVITCEGHCADGTEDDGDGLVDCADPDCQNLPGVWPQCAQGAIGSSCTGSGDCNAGLTCETNFPGGYCYQACGPMEACPNGSFCWAGVACVQPCVGADNDACPRPEHVCEPLVTGGVTTPFCRPDCALSCPNGTTCRPDTLQCM
jgi:hypothetical protein